MKIKCIICASCYLVQIRDRKEKIILSFFFANCFAKQASVTLEQYLFTCGFPQKLILRCKVIFNEAFDPYVQGS